MSSQPFGYIALCLLLGIACRAQETPALEVVEAIAPVYPAAALDGRISGTVTVGIRVSRGAVISASIGEGQALLRQASLEAARQWRFRTQSEDRALKLTFSYRLMPKNTPEAQLGAVFKPPYAVEVRKIAEEPVTHYAQAGSASTANRLARIR